MALWLPPDGVVLFLRMIKRDQRHSLDVQQALLIAGHDQPDLLAAALLHDAAKTAQPGHRLKLSHRVAVVLRQAGPTSKRTSAIRMMRTLFLG